MRATGMRLKRNCNGTTEHRPARPHRRVILIDPSETTSEARSNSWGSSWNTIHHDAVQPPIAAKPCNVRRFVSIDDACFRDRLDKQQAAWSR